ncbi:MAG: shikimate dehydrogenase [Cellvibrionaceae bacterium]|nr:shikimate dehydrogenase [Cellvibrionaceae bacterium]
MNKIDRYAVFGNPITHSKSPFMHTHFAEQTQQQMDYRAECIAVGQFVAAANQFFQTGGKGLNITVPFKQDAFDYAQRLTARAQLAGAVNTLAKQDDGCILGDNTDGAGMLMAIQQHLQWPLENKRILLLGAGGAVRGVLGPLLSAKPLSVTIANRTVSKANVLADIFSDNFSTLHTSSYTELENQQFDCVINGTSASLTGNLPPLPDTILAADAYCYDMMYSKDLTPFLNWARAQGAKHLSDGLGMLVYQGAASFYLWRGVKPDVATVISNIRQALPD